MKIVKIFQWLCPQNSKYIARALYFPGWEAADKNPTVQLRDDPLPLALTRLSMSLTRLWTRDALCHPIFRHTLDQPAPAIPLTLSLLSEETLLEIPIREAFSFPQAAIP